MTRGSRPAKSSQGRAGFKPRHKPTRLSPSTACACLAARSVCESASFLEDWRAAPPAQSPPYDVDVRACLSGSMFTNHHSRITIHKQAKQRLIATFAKSKTGSTYSKHAVYENPNRNKNAHPPRTDVQPKSASAEESRILRSGRIRGPKDLSCGPKWEYASGSQILIYGTGIRNRSKVLKT
jgi:hypothetical protein